MKLTRLFLPIIIILSAVFASLRFNSLQIGTSYDDAKYIILAESLASGEGYQLINFPRPQIERNFPPGWALLLAPFTLAFPKNYDALKIVSLVLWLASIFLVHKFFSKRLASPHLEILTAFVALNPLLIGTSVTVMSETAYLFFSLLALLAFDKADGRKYGWLALAILLTFYTQQIRTIGIALTASLIIVLFLFRRWRDLGLAAVILVVGFSFQSWLNLRNGGTVISSGYEAQVLSGSMLEKISQVWSNVSGYFDGVLSGSLIPIFGTRLDAMFGWLFLALNIVILLVLFFGFFRSQTKLEWMHIYFVIYTVGILAFWNPQVGSVKARFLIPILPMLYFYFLQGSAWLAETFMPRKSNTVLLGMTAFIALVLIARNLQDWRSPIREQITDLSIGSSWVAENAPTDAIVMVNEPAPAYVHVKRKTINFPKNGQGLVQYLHNQGIDYIIISPLLQSPKNANLSKDAQSTLSQMESLPNAFLLVFEDGGNNVRVYQYIGQ